MERGISTGINTLLGKAIVVMFCSCVGYFCYVLGSVAISFSKGW